MRICYVAFGLNHGCRKDARLTAWRKSVTLGFIHRPAIVGLATRESFFGLGEPAVNNYRNCSQIDRI